MSDEKTQLARAMMAELNCWMPEYLHTITAIAQAVRTGELTEQILDKYPHHCFPEQLSRGIAHQAGLPFSDEPDEYGPGGYPINVDADDVGVSIGALRAIAAGMVSINGNGFSFYDETLQTHGLTLGRAAQLMREHSNLSLHGAAMLVLAALEIPIHHAHQPPD